MRTSLHVIPSPAKSLGERQPWTLIDLILLFDHLAIHRPWRRANSRSPLPLLPIGIIIATFTVLTPLFSQLQQQSDSQQPLESTLVAGRGEESDKCVWLGICD